MAEEAFTLREQLASAAVRQSCPDSAERRLHGSVRLRSDIAPRGRSARLPALADSFSQVQMEGERCHQLLLGEPADQGSEEDAAGAHLVGLQAKHGRRHRRRQAVVYVVVYGRVWSCMLPPRP